MSSFKLHLLIEEKKWPTALLFLQDPEALPSTRQPYKDNLPLHMACDRKAPDELILALLRANEEAAHWPGRNKNLPLHIAAQRDLSFDVVDALIRISPQALEARNASNYTPRDYGVTDTQVFQALNRPTCCWVELIEEEGREENQDRTVIDMHKTADESLHYLDEANSNYSKLLERIDIVRKKLQDCARLQSPELVERVAAVEKNVKERVQRVHNMGVIVDENALVSDARNCIASAASLVRQKDIEDVQKLSARELGSLRSQLEELKLSIAAKRQ